MATRVTSSWPRKRDDSDAINFMATHGRGLICLSMTPERIDELDLPLMVRNEPDYTGAAFTVSIEAAKGVTTGISAADRAKTILTAIDPQTGPDDFMHPGHIFPIRAEKKGILVRFFRPKGPIRFSPGLPDYCLLLA